jgi:hypothetical protein
MEMKSAHKFKHKCKVSSFIKPMNLKKHAEVAYFEIQPEVCNLILDSRDGP